MVVLDIMLCDLGLCDDTHRRCGVISNRTRHRQAAQVVPDAGWRAVGTGGRDVPTHLYDALHLGGRVGLVVDREVDRLEKPHSYPASRTTIARESPELASQRWFSLIRQVTAVVPETVASTPGSATEAHRLPSGRPRLDRAQGPCLASRASRGAAAAGSV